MKRLLALLFGVALINSTILIANADNTINIDIKPRMISLEFPSEISLTINEDGTVEVPQDLAVLNFGDSDVIIDNIVVTGKSNWDIVDFSNNVDEQPIDTKQLAMQFRGDGTNSDGEVRLTESNWVVPKNSNLPLNIAAKIPKQSYSTSLTNQNIEIAQVNYEFSVYNEVNTIGNDWNKDRVIEDSITKVNISYSSNNPNVYIENVVSDNNCITLERASESYLSSGAEVWNVIANDIGVANVTAALNTGEQTTFQVNVYDLKRNENNKVVIEVPNNDNSIAEGDIETGDITIDIPIITPDGEDKITVVPNIPDGTTVSEGKNNIITNVEIDGVVNEVEIIVNIESTEITVSYTTNGHGEIDELSRVFHIGDSITFPNIQPEEGYEFNGWVIDDTNTKIDESYILSEDITVEAQFDMIVGDSRLISIPKMRQALQMLTGNIVFSTEKYNPDTHTGTYYDISEEGDKSVIAVVNGQDATVYADGGSIAPEDCSQMFGAFTSYGDGATSDEWYRMSYCDLRGMDFSNTKEFIQMFMKCQNMKQINLEGIDTSNAIDFCAMFAFCHSLENIDMSDFDTSKVKNIASIFQYCYKLDTIDFSSLDLTNISQTSFSNYCGTVPNGFYWAFDLCYAKNCYARTQEECDLINRLVDRKHCADFVVKGS